MFDAPRLRLALAGIPAAAMLAGCMTHHVKPQLSQAVLDARAHRDAPTGPTCPQAPLTELSGVLVGFPFDDSALPPDVGQSLATPIQWLTCRPAAPVVIRPDADGHGTPAAQDALARARADAVLGYLTGRGVAATRIRILSRGEAEPADEHFLIRAEGRRW